MAGAVLSLIDSLRAKRQIVGDTSTLEARHVAYLGLYNPTRHLDSIQEWISRMDADGIPLLVVDNSPQGAQLDAAVTENWTAFKSIVYVRNPMNLGGFGSLATNLDLLSKADWVTTFHQDDQYPAKHLRVHGELATNATADVAIVASEQESFSPKGEKLGYPRASWFLGAQPDPVALFLANLRHHTIPFSGATFRLEMLRGASIPWHSTSFPDTEIVLKMLPRWSSVVTSDSIVRYLENPVSESHSIPESERDFGASMALVRVFGAAGFGEICKLLSEQEIEGFTDALTSGLSQRLQGTQAARATEVLALEVMLEHLGPHPSITSRLEPYYAQIGAASASTLLHDLHSFGELGNKNSREGCEPVATWTEKGKETSEKFLKSKAVHQVARVLGFLPRPARVIVWKIAIGLLGLLGIKTNWKRDRL